MVDDEQSLLELYSEALEPYFEITLATSAKEAGFQLHKKAFKVVISDHLMPGGNGLSFLVDAREEYPDMQRILVTGYMKPDAEIYEYTANQLGVRFDECLFTDDREEYCEAARAVGMQAIHYQSFNLFKAELEKIL